MVLNIGWLRSGELDRVEADIRAVVDGYALRWKIEEFHRTWKRGRCRV